MCMPRNLLEGLGLTWQNLEKFMIKLAQIEGFFY